MPAAVRAQQPVVDKLVLDDTIQPVSAGMLERAIARANSQGATALLVEMDTPGGLVDSMRAMAGAILGSRVPVIVYVALRARGRVRRDFFCWKRLTWRRWRRAPKRARRMWSLKAAKPDDTEAEGGERRRGISALLCDPAQPQHRSGDRGRCIVALLHRRRGAGSAPDRSDRATTMRSCSTQSTGARSRAWTASKLTLHLAECAHRSSAADLRENLLGWLVNPNIALLLLVGGALLIYLEFNTPGTIVPGALGTLMVLLASSRWICCPFATPRCCC